MSNVSFFAFASGKDSNKTFEARKLYIGIAPVRISCVNPSKTELEKLLGTEINEAPKYVDDSEINTPQGTKQVKRVRLDFFVNTNPDKFGIDLRTKVTFFLKNGYHYNSDGTKVKVINKYGETAWLPLESVKTKTLPDNMSWFDPDDIRPSYVGEEELTKFIKAYLGIPNKSYKDKEGNVVELKNKADAEARLDNISQYFSGNIEELRNVVAMQPNNEVKVLFGVRETENGMYQTVYTREFMKSGVRNYDYFKSRFMKNPGSSSDIFEVCDLKEYVVEATEFKQEVQTQPEPDNTSGPVDDLPFDMGTWLGN